MGMFLISTSPIDKTSNTRKVRMHRTSAYSRVKWGGPSEKEVEATVLRDVRRMFMSYSYFEEILLLNHQSCPRLHVHGPQDSILSQ
uniref:Ovule protein n=1 Tax=Steinernema glaseri TaxID=37863 RepID=A0A1I7YS41_9BILA